MWAFTVTLMQIGKTILCGSANDHTSVCVHGENKAEEQYQTPGQRTFCYENSYDFTILQKVKSHLMKFLMLSWM